MTLIESVTDIREVVAVLCGILVGPYGFRLVVVDEWVSRVDFTREFCRVVIAIQVCSDMKDKHNEVCAD